MCMCICLQSATFSFYPFFFSSYKKKNKIKQTHIKKQQQQQKKDEVKEKKKIIVMWGCEDKLLSLFNRVNCSFFFLGVGGFF